MSANAVRRVETVAVGAGASHARLREVQVAARARYSVLRATSHANLRGEVGHPRALKIRCQASLDLDKQIDIADALQTPEAAVAHASKELAKAEEALRCSRMAGMVCKLGQVLGRPLDFTRDAGEGAFANVAFAVDSNTGEQFAIKLSQGEENMDLLDRESEALKYLNSLDGSERHVIQMLYPYVQFEVSLGADGRETVGAVVLEGGDCDVDYYVTQKVRTEPSLETMQTVATVLNNWEESLGWLHSQGILHLDIKAENAVLCSDQGNAVKIIDVTGMLTRSHSASGDDMSIPAEELLWETTKLHKLGIPYVSTETYVQPEEAGPGSRIIDYSADWWSMGISKVEILGLHPALFELEEGTGDIVLESLAAGTFDGFMRSQLAELLEEGDDSETVAVWADSVMTNLQGRRSEAPVSVNMQAAA